MNREIKFRGLRTDGEGWVYGFPYSSMYDEDIDQIVEWDYHHDIIPETVGQFTGLYDKNGTEIYEGDLVQWHNASGIHYNMGIVTWCNTKSAYVVRNHDYEDYMYDVHYARIEVIGNIHKNNK